LQGITPAAISVLLVYAKRGFAPDKARFGFKPDEQKRRA